MQSFSASVPPCEVVFAAIWEKPFDDEEPYAKSTRFDALVGEHATFCNHAHP
ncbi:MAG: hypothetical protein WA957_10620 [Alteraurantiacibacter sp.]